MAMSVFLAGTTHEVNTMARHINRLHATVTGTINQASAGQHPVGEPYTGMDPDGLLWVQVSFVDSMLSAYEHFVGPLSDAEREQYWQESLRYAKRLGLTDATLPASYAAMQTYLRESIASGEVAVSPGARTVAHTVLYPPLPWYRQRLWGIVRLITSGQLPGELRKGYGLRWTWADWLAFKLVSNVLRLARWLFPKSLGRSVLMNFAERRVRGELVSTEPKTPSGVAG
jgi:uncharacterized protein (DUF2236 family)